MAAPTVPPDPLDWLPQRPLVTRVAVTIADPIVEPLWSGTRVLAHVGAGGPGQEPVVRLIDGIGLEVTESEPHLAARIGASLLAHDAVIDGVLTNQATRGGEGAAIVPQARVGVMDTMFSREPGISVARPPDDADPTEDAFVAVDLLRLDGRSLLDIPLLERKRLLESVIDQGPLVRVSVFCRPPVDAWVASWQGAGLRGAMLKGANSRYIPGDRTPEWRTITRVAARR